MMDNNNKSSKRYKSLSQKQMPKKKKQSTQTELFANVKTAKYRFKHSSHSKWWTTNKKRQKIWNWYFIYQFHQRPLMSLNWYPFHQNNDEQKQTKNGHYYAIWRQTIQTWRNIRHATPFCLHKTKAKSFYMTLEKLLL